MVGVVTVCRPRVHVFFARYVTSSLLLCIVFFFVVVYRVMLCCLLYYLALGFVDVIFVSLFFFKKKNFQSYLVSCSFSLFLFLSLCPFVTSRVRVLCSLLPKSLSQCGPCSHASFCATAACACVIRRHLSGASTSRRTVFVFETVPRHESSSQNLAKICPLTWLTSVRFETRFQLTAAP